MRISMLVPTICSCLFTLVAALVVSSAAAGPTQLQQAGTHGGSPARRLLATSFPPADWGSLQFNIQTGQLFDVSTHRLPGVDVYIIDGLATPPATVTAMLGAGLSPVCYLRAGTAEAWAPDYASFAAGDKGDALASDPDQFWVDVRSANVRSIMSARISACASAGYKAVLADFISDYGQTPGNSLGLTLFDYADYLIWLSDTVAAANMGFGSMDGPDVLNVPGVFEKVGFAVATSCRSRNTCTLFATFPAAGKPVLVWEKSHDWVGGTNAYLVDACAQHAGLGLITLLKGSANSTRELQALPWIGCPPPFFTPLANQPPAFPPMNWATRLPPLALNFQPRQAFDVNAERLTNISAYALSGWSNPAATVANMTASGLFPICYMSVGTASNASADWGAFQAAHLGGTLPNRRERWVDVRVDAVRAIMFSRLALCASKGFSAILLDNIYSSPESNALGLNTTSYTDYLQWLVEVVHGMGLTVGALDGGELLQAMSPLPQLDFGVTQECVRLSTCERYKATYVNRPWFNVEFEDAYEDYLSFMAQVCSKEASMNLTASLKARSLRALPWSSCSMAPGAVQLGSIPVSPQVKVVNGDLCLRGMPRMVNGSMRAPMQVDCGVGPRYLTILNGTLSLPDVEDGIALGPAMFSFHRSVDWWYDATLQSFSASVNISGSLEMVLWDNFTSALATVPPVEVNVTGRVTLTSKVYPGPGFSGLYTWTGSLSMSPDPFLSLGLGQLSMSRRRHLLAAAGSDTSDTRVAVGGPERRLLQAGASSGGAAAAAAAAAAAVDVVVHGNITAAEASTISPSTDVDAVRGDASAWVEPSGAVRILNSDEVPESMIPFWKTPAPPPPGLSATARMLIYLFSGLTALMLGTLVGLAVYLHVLRKRQAAKEAGVQDAYGLDEDPAGAPGYGPPDLTIYGPKGEVVARPPSSAGPNPIMQHAREYDEQERPQRHHYPGDGSGDGRVRRTVTLPEQDGWGSAAGNRRTT